MIENKDLDTGEIFSLAIKNHKENNIEVAKDLYNQVLELDSTFVGALNNLGIIFQSLDDIQKAKNYFEKAITIKSDYAEAHQNLGFMFVKLDDNQKAKNCFERAITIKPDYIEAYNNLGSTLYRLGYAQEAIDCYEKAITINPNNVALYSNYGVTLQALGKYEEAIDCYKKAIKINPNDAAVYNNYGTVLKSLGDSLKAISSFEKAIEIDPNYLDPLKNVSNVYIGMLDFEKSISTSNKSLKIQQNFSKFTNQSIPLFKLKHDVEQARYLSLKNYKVEGIEQFQKVGAEILSRNENKEVKNDANKNILLNEKEIDTLLPFYKSDFLYQPKKITGSCINPDKNWQTFEDEYLNSEKKIMYIDDFLSDEAIKELREFCLVSKVWNKVYPNKYLGARADCGFISPIHLQIATDLQQKLPKLFGPHRLTQFWGFKYDATLGSGINVHADFAVHNLNFWITPDEYNNDKNSGGLKVYDVPAPLNWTFKDYNHYADKIYQFLRDSGANCTNIPYKYNRAVLFNSDYFHETDKVDFKDEYEGRRINNTYLFGTRLVEKVK